MEQEPIDGETSCIESFFQYSGYFSGGKLVYFVSIHGHTLAGSLADSDALSRSGHTLFSALVGTF
eukprot:scaffold711299_cov126-Attheya_sp.AAC.1